MKTLSAAVFTASLLLLSLTAAGADAAEITADVLTYNGVSKTASAQGNIIIKDEGAVMTGSSGEYHFNDRSAYLTGGVTYQKEDTSLTAASVTLSGDQTLHGTGSVVIHDGERSLYGDDVTYNTNTGYGLAEGSARAELPDGTITAPRMEGNLKGIRITATGGVHIVSDPHQLTADGDTAVYTKSPDADDGRIVLTGNARATQNGNTFTGPELDMDLRANLIQTKGRSTLIITNTNA